MNMLEIITGLVTVVIVIALLLFTVSIPQDNFDYNVSYVETYNITISDATVEQSYTSLFDDTISITSMYEHLKNGDINEITDYTWSSDNPTTITFNVTG